jgi:hypothetical protein
MNRHPSQHDEAELLRIEIDIEIEPEPFWRVRAAARQKGERELRNRREKPWRAAITSAALLAAVTVSGSPARADEAGGPPTWQVQTLVTAHRFMPDEPRADPDQPSLRYGLHGGRWKAMLGAGVVLAGVESDQLRLGLALDGFVELLNFDRGEPVPWESYRANVGFELLAESPSLSRALLPPGGRLTLALGWFHESDHAANQEGYIKQYLAPPSFLPGKGFISPSLDNGNFSSYEYVKLRAGYRQPLFGGRLIAQSTLGARLFPGTIDPGSIRGLRAAVLAEARFTVRVSEGVRPFASGYYELLASDFVARDRGFRFGLDRTPLRYEIVHLGVDLVSAGGGICSPYFSYSSSNGRGIDFPRFFSNEIGFGITFLP